MSEQSPSEQSPTPQLLPRTGRIAGIDFGTVRIGVSITDPDQMLASPYENYDRRSETKDRDYFRELASGEAVVGWVVGLPIHTDGNESQKSGEAREFGGWLGELSGLPVTFFDERFTSAFANEVMRTAKFSSKKKKKRLDMIAAQIMLTAYLESSRSQSNRNLAD